MVSVLAHGVPSASGATARRPFVCEEAHATPGRPRHRLRPTRRRSRGSRTKAASRRLPLTGGATPRELDAPSSAFSTCSRCAWRTTATAIVLSAVSDAAASLLAFVPSLAPERFRLRTRASRCRRGCTSGAPGHYPEERNRVHGRMESGAASTRFHAIVWTLAAAHDEPKLTQGASEPARRLRDHRDGGIHGDAVEARRRTSISSSGERRRRAARHAALRGTSDRARDAGVSPR